MSLPDGHSDVAPGKIAAVVTSLEMTARPPARPERAHGGWTLRRVAEPDPGWYRALYRRVGGDWLWYSRLRLDDERLAGIIGHPKVEVHALVADGRDEGLLELDFRVAGECELAFFGLARPLLGRGAGRFLMNRAIAAAWARPIRRFWVHTCTLDHPAAVEFYRRSGFRPYRVQVEIDDDPRIDGTLPRDAAPHVPIIAPAPGPNSE